MREAPYLTHVKAYAALWKPNSSIVHHDKTLIPPNVGKRDKLGKFLRYLSSLVLIGALNTACSSQPLSA